MLRILYIALLVCISISLSFAQDSTKKAKTVQPAVKTAPSVPKYRVYKYHSKADSIAAKTGSYPSYTAKTDSVFPSFLADKSLKGQYQFLLTQLHYKQRQFASVMWKTLSDTLAIKNKKIKDSTNKIVVQSKLIDSLKAAAAQTVSDASEHKDEISFIGITLSVTLYNTIVWVLILGLGLTAIIVVVQSGSNRHEAKYRTRLYTELEDEFKAYKAKANDKEKKLARELQTERNKLDELLGRG